MLGLSASAQHPGGRSEVRAGFLCSLVGAGEAQGCSLGWTPCIYSSDEVHGANRKEYISLLSKIPRIAKQDLAFFLVLFLSFVVRSSLNLLNLDCMKLINQEALL